MGSFSVRKRKQFICFSVLKALTAAAVLTAMSCGGAVAVENIKVTPTALSLGIGETAVLKAEVEPADASVNAVLWSVTQGTAVTVDGYGKVTALAAGTATVTAKTVDGGKTASCTVTVGSISGGTDGSTAVESVTLDRSSVTLGVGNSVTLQATVEPATAAAAVVWSLASGDGILTVDQKGRITAKAIGAATVAVEAGGETATCLVTVIREGVIADLNFIAAVENALPSWNPKWQKEADGTVRMNLYNTERVKKVETLMIVGTNLSSFDGIEYFTGLTSLTCPNNRLTALDVSNLHNLETLDCSGNQISSENLKLPSAYLKTLDCSNNRLERLDETVLPATLTELDCSDNPLTVLNVDFLNETLTKLECAATQLSSLSVASLTNLTYLDCSFNRFTALDVTALRKLEELYCHSNRLTSLKVSGLTILQVLSCYDNQLSVLDMSRISTTLTKLACAKNRLASLDVSKLTELTYLDCEKNKIKELDITPLTRLGASSFFRCGGQDIGGSNTVLLVTATQNSAWKSNWQEFNRGVEVQEQ